MFDGSHAHFGIMFIHLDVKGASSANDKVIQRSQLI